MIVCSCRNISTTDFSNLEDLKNRIMEHDHKCGICQNKYLLEQESLLELSYNVKESEYGLE